MTNPQTLFGAIATAKANLAAGAKGADTALEAAQKDAAAFLTPILTDADKAGKIHRGPRQTDIMVTPEVAETLSEFGITSFNTSAKADPEFGEPAAGQTSRVSSRVMRQNVMSGIEHLVVNGRTHFLGASALVDLLGAQAGPVLASMKPMQGTAQDAGKDAPVIAR